MTGYGVASQESSAVKYTVEIKSLNSKYLELNIRLPKVVSDKELILRGECSKLIERGKVNLTVTSEYTDPTASASVINTELLKSYYYRLKEVADEVADEAASLFSLALNMPEVIAANDVEPDEEEEKILMDAFFLAVASFNKFREDEGAVLKVDLEKRVRLILSLLQEVEAVEGDRIPLIRERLTQTLEATVGKDSIDNNRFEQELIYYIDKFDVTEEIVRLKSHCNYFIQALETKDSNGKKLGFISQEMGREINTLGSKANNADIQQVVVRMKEELEKIKEQLLNVL